MLCDKSVEKKLPHDAIKHLDKEIKEILFMCVGKAATSPARRSAEPKESQPPTLALAGMTKAQSEFVQRQKKETTIC